MATKSNTSKTAAKPAAKATAKKATPAAKPAAKRTPAEARAAYVPDAPSLKGLTPAKRQALIDELGRFRFSEYPDTFKCSTCGEDRKSSSFPTVKSGYVEVRKTECRACRAERTGYVAKKSAPTPAAKPAAKKSAPAKSAPAAAKPAAKKSAPAKRTPAKRAAKAA